MTSNIVIIHIALLLVCILLVEIFIRSNFLSALNSILKMIKRTIKVITSNNFSDHSKEKALRKYSLRIIIYSFRILIILLSIVFIFLIMDFFSNDFLSITFSFIGIIESLAFSMGYLFIRKSITK